LSRAFVRTDADNVADKLTPYILDAITRATTEPAGLPLHASRSEPGLFPGTIAAKPAALKSLTEGYFHVVRTEATGKQTRELYAVTEKGLNFLLDQVSPKQVLEDFVRVLEERQEAVTQLLTTATRMAESLKSIQAVVVAVLPKVDGATYSGRAMAETLLRSPNPIPPPVLSRNGRPAAVPQEPLTTRELSDLLLTRLRDWSSSAGVARDCPLPELFASLSTLEPSPTVGQFHDALRFLQSAGRVYLHPWTAPLYALPEPPLALMVGHEVAFYASVRTEAFATSTPHLATTGADVR
jgi:hypothetical protein